MTPAGALRALARISVASSIQARTRRQKHEYRVPRCCHEKVDTVNTAPGSNSRSNVSTFRLYLLRVMCRSAREEL
jgi:hypothetical protein